MELCWRCWQWRCGAVFRRHRLLRALGSERVEEVAERVVDELVLLAGLHEAAAVQAHLGHRPGHVGPAAEERLTEQLVESDETPGAPESGRAVHERGSARAQTRARGR